MIISELEIRQRLDRLASSAKATISSLSDLSPRARALAICKAMRDDGIVAARDIDYYAIANSFIHLSLEGRGGLPITLAIIFTAIASRCELSAAPINYVRIMWGTLLTFQPEHCFVAVSSSSDFPIEQTFFLDVFNGGTIRTYGDLSDPLSQGGPLPRGMLRPAGVVAMMRRVAHNIIHSINQRPANGLELPWFAALSALTILESDFYLYGRLCDFVRATPSLCDTDIDTIEQACMYPAVDEYEDHLEFCRLARYYDTVGPPPKKRTHEYSSVKFRIGQIFKHRLFEFSAPVFARSDFDRYVGVIYGFDNRCNQSDAWKENMVRHLVCCSLRTIASFVPSTWRGATILSCSC